MTPNVGNLAPNPSPYNMPVLQEVSVEFKGDLKELHGQFQYALDILRGKIKVTGKGKMIVPAPDLLGQLYFGLPTTAGVERPILNESHPPGATVEPTQSTADNNLGVLAVTADGTTYQMQRVATAQPAVGQYKFTAATSGAPVTPAEYTFAAAETAAQVLLSYTYPDTIQGSTIKLTNQLIGSAPQAAMTLFNYYKSKLYSLTLNAVVLGGFSVPTKQEDHWVTDFDFEAAADGAGILGYIQADQ